MREAKADSAKRIVAAALDLGIAWVSYAILQWVFGRFLGYLGASCFLLLRDQSDPWFFSLGKKLLGLRVVRGDGNRCDHIASIKRNLTMAAFFLVSGGLTLIFAVIPFVDWRLAVLIGALVGLLALGMELFKLLTDERGARLGDLLADTRVIDAVAFGQTAGRPQHDPARAATTGGRH